MIKSIFFTLAIVYSSTILAKVSPAVVAIGIVSLSPEDISLSTTKNSLSDDNVLMCFDTPDQKRKCSSLPGSKFVEVITNDSVTDVSSEKEIHTFRYIMNKSDNTDAVYGIAVIYSSKQKVDYKMTLNTYPSELSILLDDKKMNFNLCTSVEGVHVYAPQYKNSMHIYLSLGYEVSPTCSNDVYQ
ncbi:Uncharacterised protein [Yersinia pseudotuberculosis]|uniref:Uncharacterized protein n=1 Tax=Yersinia pekkanenii TaxID=1288385 RepID=A0A0T9R9R9_9GAMM|nr:MULTISPECIES: hypothetical protein [Yersinia]AJJ08514.1 hypothetical protein BZ20_2938 [Yersinia pseudotuberculosis]MBO1553431.1 hypothetical protein [Yersinia pseudotuberculosis]MBO1561344.1 hypothetical protein [Yersinia pseudotuberculosis]CNI51373.1 Uncharacterised protein [Yersinia pekkanenii]CNK17148.1 Uncharacterised protein [Yersinia pseudotuberculosis]